jgi:hypothetical protein
VKATSDEGPRSARPKPISMAGAALAFGLAAALFFTSNDLSRVWNPGEWGSFGFTFGDVYGWRVTVASVVSGSAAERAGIKPGDQLDFATAHDRAMGLLSTMSPGLPTGEQVHPVLIRPGVRRTVGVTTLPLPRLSVSDSIAIVLLYAELLTGMGIALFLVLVRMSRMTWGFYFVVLATIFQYSPDESLFLAYLVSHFGPWIIGAQNFTYLAGAVGFLVFCARFPTDAPRGWAKRLDSAAPYIFAVGASLHIWQDVVGFSSGGSTLVDALDDTNLAANVPIVAAGLAVLLVGFFHASNPDRQRIKWVVLGLVCSFTALALGTVTNFLNLIIIPPSWTFWWMTLLALLALVLPLTVTYSIIRHRVIDVRFILDRTLTLGAIVSIAAIAVIAVDWLFSARLPATPIVMALYGGIAVLVGLALGAGRGRIRKAIDFLLFRRWYQTQEQADEIVGEISRATSKSDIYEPLTADVARAFSIASAAIFERVADGGYVRVAAIGWQREAFWHIFQDDPLVTRAHRRMRSLVIDANAWPERCVPLGVARPAMAVPIMTGKHVPAIALYGAHENGTGADPDEIAMIHSICADARFVYERVDSPGSDLAPILSHRGAPLGA